MEFRARLGAALLVLAGCQTYQPEPLDPDKIFRDTHAARGGDAVVTLTEAKELMREHSPAIREARAAHATTLAVAAIKTPLPNPRVDVAPIRIVGGDVLDADRLGVESLLGWSIVFSGRLKRTDELNKFVAEQAMIESVATEREQYLLLRREYLLLAQSLRKLEARGKLLAALEELVERTRRSAAAGNATTLDLKQVELEHHRIRLTVAEAREKVVEARGQLGLRAGIALRRFESGLVPDLPGEIPSQAILEGLIGDHHPELSRRRAAYETIERELALEISKQYPDLDIGLIYERDGGANRWGLGFGIDIPIFDRNQVGIARTRARRAQQRVAFEAEASRILASIESARARLEVRRARYVIARDEVAPAAEEALALARRVLDAGEGDALRFLSALRDYLNAQLLVLAEQEDVLLAWSDLELACGTPLLRFPEDKEKKE